MNVLKPLMLLAEFVAGPRGLQRIFSEGADVPAAEVGDGDHQQLNSDMPRPDDWARWPSRLRSRPRFHP
jgi:hypothetical protein